ncbi:lysozyme g-like [Plectropomus leopardus]|uniref:lysozyme g-like n=1 Tax=Plectropomus leopardus TaxID=160734 RepID=UPI001C4AA118|nr:lysozyme g-like [Plectropomus leopardus]
MPPKPVKRAMEDALKNLGEDDVKRFCSAILDRTEEPRVRKADLEGKNRREIVDILVQFHTEAKAEKVVVETLGEIGCNEVKRRLGFGNIMLVKTTGASMQTAQQDKLQYQGERASWAMAESDLLEMNNYKTIIQNVAQKKGLDPALIAAIISRSCRAGKTLTAGKGCYDEERKAFNTYGLMQIDINPKGGGHTPKGAWDSEEHLSQATDILLYFMLRIKHAFPDWTKEQQLKGGIAAYNAGDGNIHSYEEVDAKTSCGDYSNDVVARAQWYKTEGGF